MKTVAKLLIIILIFGAVCAFSSCTGNAEDGNLLEFEI
jgi:hypothetical protein